MKRYNLIPLLLLAALLFSCSSKEPIPGKSIEKEVESLLRSKNEADEFNGTALVVHNDSTYTYAYGWAHINNSIKLEVDNVFYLGSLAKQFTGISIMLLAKDGKLSLDDPVTTYFDSLPAFCNTISIRNMLNHTSGLPDYYGMGIFEPGMTNEMVIEAMYSLDSLDFQPGSSYAYSNSGYVLLSVIAEKASGMSFHNFMRMNVFDPLLMKSSVVYDTTEPDLPTRAYGHTDDGQLDDYNAFTTGGGGIFSNLSDLYRWIKGLDEFRLLEKELMLEAYRPARLSNDSLSYYGFGWRLEEDNSAIVQHSGSLAGFRTYLYRNMETGTIIILLSNFSNNVSALNSEILTLLDE